jgi:hypothetical protein
MAMSEQDVIGEKVTRRGYRVRLTDLPTRGVQYRFGKEVHF